MYKYYPPGYNAIGEAPLQKGVMMPSVSTVGLKVGEWLIAKGKVNGLRYKYSEVNAQQRRKASKPITLFARAERSIRRIITRRER